MTRTKHKGNDMHQHKLSVDEESSRAATREDHYIREVIEQSDYPELMSEKHIQALVGWRTHSGDSYTGFAEGSRYNGVTVSRAVMMFSCLLANTASEFYSIYNDCSKKRQKAISAKVSHPDRTDAELALATGLSIATFRGLGNYYLPLVEALNKLGLPNNAPTTSNIFSDGWRESEHDQLYEKIRGAVTEISPNDITVAKVSSRVEDATKRTVRPRMRLLEAAGIVREKDSSSRGNVWEHMGVETMGKSSNGTSGKDGKNRLVAFKNGRDVYHLLGENDSSLCNSINSKPGTKSAAILTVSKKDVPDEFDVCRACEQHEGDSRTIGEVRSSIRNMTDSDTGCGSFTKAECLELEDKLRGL